MKRRVVYLGPDEYRVFHVVEKGERVQYTFERDVPVEVSAEFAAELLQMNPRGCTLETARDYAAQLFAYADESAGGDE